MFSPAVKLKVDERYKMKVCKICEVEKDESEYYERKKGSGILFVFCKDCFRARQRKYHNENLEKERARLKLYYAKKKA